MYAIHETNSTKNHSRNRANTTKNKKQAARVTCANLSTLHLCQQICFAKNRYPRLRVMHPIEIQGVEFLTNDMADPYHGLDRNGY